MNPFQFVGGMPLPQLVTFSAVDGDVERHRLMAVIPKDRLSPKSRKTLLARYRAHVLWETSEQVWVIQLVGDANIVDEAFENRCTALIKVG